MLVGPEQIVDTDADVEQIPGATRGGFGIVVGSPAGNFRRVTSEFGESVTRFGREHSLVLIPLDSNHSRLLAESSKQTEQATNQRPFADRNR